MEICWNVTSACNISCHHCFRIQGEKGLDYGKITELMIKLKEAGVTAISFSGGEFFMIDCAKEVLKASHDIGFSTSVTTNASLITTKDFDDVKPFLDRITFSVEFVDDKQNEKFGRGENYFSHLNEIISHINKFYPNFQIKINTAVTRENLPYLSAVSRELEKHSIESWKLMEYCPLRGAAVKNKDALEIPHATFESTVKFLQHRSSLNIKIFPKEKTENQAVISPSGQLIFSTKDMDIVLLKDLTDQPITDIHRALAITEGKKLNHIKLNTKQNEIQGVTR